MTDKVVKQIGARLRKIRRDKGYTQKHVAEEADITPNYYALIERAKVNPSVEVLESIIKVLGAKYSDILPS